MLQFLSGLKIQVWDLNILIPPPKNDNVTVLMWFKLSGFIFDILLKKLIILFFTMENILFICNT